MELADHIPLKQGFEIWGRSSDPSSIGIRECAYPTGEKSLSESLLRESALARLLDRREAPYAGARFVAS